MHDAEEFPVDDLRLSYACLNEFEKQYIRAIYKECVQNKPRFEGSEAGVKSVFRCFDCELSSPNLSSSSLLLFWKQHRIDRGAVAAFHYHIQMFISRKLSNAQKTAYFDVQRNFFHKKDEGRTHADFVDFILKNNKKKVDDDGPKDFLLVSQRVDLEESRYLFSFFSPKSLAGEALKHVSMPPPNIS